MPCSAPSLAGENRILQLSWKASTISSSIPMRRCWWDNNLWIRFCLKQDSNIGVTGSAHASMSPWSADSTAAGIDTAGFWPCRYSCSCSEPDTDIHGLSLYNTYAAASPSNLAQPAYTSA